MPFSFASPEDLVELQRAVDAAWAVIADHPGSDPLKASGERERLAYLIASLWSAGTRDGLVQLAIEKYWATWSCEII